MGLKEKHPKYIDKDNKELKMMTVGQFCAIIGRSTQQIYQKGQAQIRHKGNYESGLDIIYPYPNTTEEKDRFTGPKFIIINIKAKEYMDRCDEKRRKKGVR